MHSRMMDYVLSAAEHMPRAFTMIGYALEAYPRYKSLNRGGQHIYWYRLGAKLGDYMAAYNLGQCYEVGRGVSQNAKLAVFWWKRAATQGHPLAFANLGAAYYNGSGVRRNVKKALRLYGRGALSGDRVAQRMLNKLAWL
jgi:TPR repeat protein